MSYVMGTHQLDQRLPVLCVMELTCGHRLLFDAYTQESLNGDYDHGMSYDCPACKYNYQRVKTVKGWPKSMDFLLACGHLETNQPYIFNIDPRTCTVYREIDVPCSICSIFDEDVFL